MTHLPLMVSVGTSATDDPLLTPGMFALPAGSVTVTAEVPGSEDTLLSGGLIELASDVRIRALVIRINVPADYPLPLLLGQRWASVAPGSVVSVTETYSERNARTSYTNARVTANSITVTRQLSLTEAYYSGTLEARVLL